jgi:signal transduction histidine kinase
MSVQDAGMGIPPHQQAQIFGRFMRADNARAAGITGADWVSISAANW